MTNVLLITADQWRGDCLSARGHPLLRTPHLDALAADGTLFASHYAQCSPCGPSRASLLTGLYLMNHRSVRNGTPLDARFTNIALEARRLGYEPALIGYTDTSLDPRRHDPHDPVLRRYEGVLPGFREAVPGSELHYAWARCLEARGYSLPPAGADIYDWFTPPDWSGDHGPTFPAARYAAADSDTAFTVDCAIEFVRHAARRPWFLHLSLLRPHPPWVAPEPYNALYDPALVPRPQGAPSLEAEASLHPFVAYAIANGHRSEGLDPRRHPASLPAMRQLRATYYGLMSEVDDNLGRLFDALRAGGCYDDTLIVFTSDHGEQLWDHWMLGKESLFDQSFYIPLIVRPPSGFTRAGRGGVVEAFTESVDVMPTLLELLGAVPPLQCDGTSLTPFLAGEVPEAWRDAAHWELDFRDIVGRRSDQQMGLPIDACSLSVIRDRFGKYVHFTALPPLFFDLERDPFERQNRAADPACASRVLDYAQRLLSWRQLHAERTLTGIRLTAEGPVERPRGERLNALSQEWRRSDTTD